MLRKKFYLTGPVGSLECWNEWSEECHYLLSFIVINAHCQYCQYNNSIGRWVSLWISLFTNFHNIVCLMNELLYCIAWWHWVGFCVMLNFDYGELSRLMRPFIYVKVVSQTHDQKCFTCLKEAADWHEPVVQQHIVVIHCHANKQLDLHYSQQTQWHTTAPIRHCRPLLHWP